MKNLGSLSLFGVCVIFCSCSNTNLGTPLPPSPSPSGSVSSPSPTDSATAPSPSASQMASATPVSSPSASPSPMTSSASPTAPAPSASPSIAVSPSPVASNPGASLDLAPLLKAAKAGETITLQSGKDYTLTETFAVSVAGLRLNMNGARVTMTPSVGASSDIVVRAPNFEMYGGTITKASVMVHSYADHTWLHDLKTTGTIMQFFISDNRTATNTLIENVSIAQTTTVAIYWTADNFTIRSSTLGVGQSCSINEYCLREEVPSDGSGVLPKNSLIDHVTVNKGPAAVKDTIGIRMGSAVIQNSTVHGHVRVGQGAATAPGANNPSFVIKDTLFDLSDDPQLSIDDGVIATVSNCTFLRTNLHPPIAIADKTTATLTGNTVQGNAPGIKPNRLWSTIFHPVVTETGTVFK